MPESVTGPVIWDRVFLNILLEDS